MLENLHNYFVLFHFIDIILPEVISMNSNDFYQLAAELNVMDFTKSKPNYADLARKYGVDYRTVKKYHEGYKGKPRNRAKPSRLDPYKELIIEKLSIPRISRKGVYEFLIDQYLNCKMKLELRNWDKGACPFIPIDAVAGPLFSIFV